MKGLDNPKLPFFEKINDVTYKWGNSLDEEAFKRISVESVYQCYKDIPTEELRAGIFKINKSIGLKRSLEKWTHGYLKKLSKNLEPLLLSLRLRGLSLSAQGEPHPLDLNKKSNRAYEDPL